MLLLLTLPTVPLLKVRFLRVKYYLSYKNGVDFFEQIIWVSLCLSPSFFWYHSHFPGISIFGLLNKTLESMMLDLKLPFLASLTEEMHVLPDFHGNRWVIIRYNELDFLVFYANIFFKAKLLSLWGLRSPIADPKAKGMVCGLTLGTSEKQLALLYLATVQGIAYGTRHIVEHCNAHGHKVRVPFHSVHILLPLFQLTLYSAILFTFFRILSKYLYNDSVLVTFLTYFSVIQNCCVSINFYIQVEFISENPLWFLTYLFMYQNSLIRICFHYFDYSLLFNFCSFFLFPLLSDWHNSCMWWSCKEPVIHSRTCRYNWYCLPPSFPIWFFQVLPFL